MTPPFGIGLVLVDDYQDCLRRDLVIGVWTTQSFLDAGEGSQRGTLKWKEGKTTRLRKKKKRAGE
jgi:hypothetical protein